MDFSIEEYSEEINLTIIEDGDLLEFSVEETVEEINLTIEEYNGADGVKGEKGDKGDKGEKGEDGLSGIQSVVAGDNITIDNTDPLNPIISAEEGGTNVTKTSDLTNDGEDGFNPFITAEDLPDQTPQVNADWNANEGVAQILNKPTIPADVDLSPYALDADLDAEVVNRAAADTALQTQITDLYIHSIAITTITSITTDTTDANGRTQNGREVAIKNGVNAITLTCELTSPANFVASYTKEGSATVTVLAGAGTTLYQTDGSNVINGIKGSTFCIKRSGNEFQLQISNR